MQYPCSLIPFAISALDCIWGDWNPHGQCSTTCGVGSRNNTRIKIVKEITGGNCPGKSTEIGEVWENLNIDLCGPLPDGFSLLAIVDQASRWPHVYVIKSTTTNVIKQKLIADSHTVLCQCQMLIEEYVSNFTS